MTLHITLREGEKMIVNGAVLRAVRRMDFAVENHVAILRGTEVMTPEQATSPARRLYFACMMAYIDSERREEQQAHMLVLLQDIMAVLESADARALCVSFARNVAFADYYRALGDCRKLIACEAAILARSDAAAA